MKLKHVKEILIGTAGVFAAGGMMVSGNQGLHMQEYGAETEKEAVAEEGFLEEEEVSFGLFAGVKLTEAQAAKEVAANSAFENLPVLNEAAETEELHLARTTQSEETKAQEPEAVYSEEAVQESSEEAKEAVQEESAEGSEYIKEEQEPASEEEAENTEKETLDKVEEAEKEAEEAEEQLQEDETEEETENAKEPEETEEPELVIATVDNYLNIRSEANLEGEVIGKLYNHSVGTLTEEAEDGWYRIESGSVDGYVKAEYVLRGEEGKELAEEVGERLAKVNTTTLRVRREPSTESDIVGLVPDGDILDVVEEVEGWAKVSVEEGEGYISTDYAEVYTENTVAESKEEEEARLWKEAEERRIAEEAAAQEWARQQAEEAARRQASVSSGSTQSSSGNTSSASAGGSQSSGNSGSTQAAGSGLGSQIANYALQFVGNPYVYGGTSLTNGADCSGFVMSVYQNFGISLPRTSGEQGQCGWDVGGLGNAKAGDLVWYSGHIGIYIGNGQIVHASSPSTGIKVSNANYRTILSVRRIV